MSVLDYLLHRERKRTSEHSSAWAKYRQLLQDFVSGNEVDSDEADQILRDAGKTESDLQSDVDTLAKRIEWRQQIDNARDAEQRRQQAESEINRMMLEVERLKAKFAPTIHQHRVTIGRTESAATAAAYARNHLTGSVLNPELTRRVDSLNDELRELHQRKRTAEDGVRNCNARYWENMLEQWRERKAEKSQYDSTGHKFCHDRIQEAKASLDSAMEREQRFHSELREVNSRIDEIQAELESCHQRMLEP